METANNINIDPTIKCAVASFVGFLELSAHQNIGDTVLNMAIKNNISKLIIDTANLQIIRPETQHWIDEDWLPRVYQSGIKYMAYVIPKEEMATMAPSRLNQKTDILEIQYVDSLANAKAWMAKK